MTSYFLLTSAGERQASLLREAATDRLLRSVKREEAPRRPAPAPLASVKCATC